MTTMARTGLIVLLTAIAALTQRPPDGKANVLKSRVPAPSAEKYRSVRDAVDWKNPYFLVLPDAVEVRTSGGGAARQTVDTADVIGHLAKLPKVSWPYGLVVAVQENGVRSGKDADSRIKRNRLELLRRLRKAGVKAELWPAA